MALPVFVTRIKVDLWCCATNRNRYLGGRSKVSTSGSTHMETVLEMDTMNAVPTPRLEVGEKQLAAQLLV